jgi:hypothetical protein
MKKIRYYYSNHYRIERFSVFFLILFIGLSSVTGFAFYKYLDKQRINLGNQAMYTVDTVSSITNTPVTIIGVFASKDKTKGFIMGRIEDMTNMPTDASKYSVMLHGLSNDGKNIVKSKSVPYGSLILYGNSGYFGLYLVDHNKFPSQISNAIIRVQSELFAKNADTSEADGGSLADSFSKYDQFQFAFNLGASETVSLQCLDSDTEPNADSFFKEAVLAFSEGSYKEALETDLTNMDAQLKRIAEYSDRLTKIDNVVLPALPDIMKNDTIVNDNGKYVLNTNSHIADYLDFDWRTKTLTKSDSYLSEVMPKYKDGYTDSNKFLADATANFKASGYPSFAYDDWKLKDGIYLSELSVADGTNNKYNAIKKDCDMFVQAVNSYIAMKADYEFSHRIGLLYLEDTLNSVNGMSTVNSGDDLIRVY